MFRYRPLLRWIGLGLLFLFSLGACLPTVPATPTPPTGGTVDEFADTLIAALVKRDYPQLQSMMGTPFTIAGWQSEGSALPPGVAIAQLRNVYLRQPQITFNSTENLTALLNGTDPLKLWGADVKAVKGIYVTGLGNDGKAEAILIIAQRPDQTPYWHGMLVAAAGFKAPSTPPTPPPATPTVLPTQVKYVQVLQNVNVRGGPGKEYPKLSFANQGAIIEVFGVSSDGQWWNVLCPDNTIGNCWVSADSTLTTPSNGPTPPQPTNTPAPATATPVSNAPTRIQFQPGAASATLRGQVTFPTQIQYLSRALAGQQMSISIQSAGNLANFAITGVTDGQPYKRLVNEDRTFTFVLPTTQDYLISVATPNGTADYTMTVSVVNGGNPTPVPTPVRINFAPGTTSATISGNVQFPNRNRYVLQAMAGQQMKVDVQSPGNLVNFAITGVTDGQPYKRLENEDRSFTFTLPSTQDYLIEIATPSSSPDYLLLVSVVSPSTPTEPERINFAPGATSATRTGQIIAGQRKEYVLQAQAGQNMSVQIQSEGNLANFAITGVTDGQPYKRLENEDRTFNLSLPSDQDYLITVATPNGAQNYTLVITIVTPPAQQPEAVRIQFEPGTSVASLNNAIRAGTIQTFILRAMAGQTMVVNITSPNNDVLLGISGVDDGTPYKRTAVGPTNATLVLPSTQDYLITAESVGSDTNYRLDVVIN